jgi:hypothetical protein
MSHDRNIDDEIERRAEEKAEEIYQSKKRMKLVRGGLGALSLFSLAGSVMAGDFEGAKEDISVVFGEIFD